MFTLKCPPIAPRTRQRGVVGPVSSLLRPAGGVPLLPEPEGDLLGARQPRQVPHPAPGRALDGSVAGEGAPRAGRLQLRGQPQPDGQAVAAVAVPGTGTNVWNKKLAKKLKKLVGCFTL